MHLCIWCVSHAAVSVHSRCVPECATIAIACRHNSVVCGNDKFPRSVFYSEFHCTSTLWVECHLCFVYAVPRSLCLLPPECPPWRQSPICFLDWRDDRYCSFGFCPPVSASRTDPVIASLQRPHSNSWINSCWLHG